MAVRIRFDPQHNVEKPSIILATKNGSFLGELPVHNLQFKDVMNSPSELRFDLYKDDFIEINKNRDDDLWLQVKDFKLVWAREWNTVFEIYVELNSSDSNIKNVTCKSLGEAELSQIKLYNIEINTEIDIERDDYKPTIIFDENDSKASLLNRLLDKAPHYRIGEVADSIKNIQRTFDFDNTSIYDALQDVAEEISCLFSFDCHFENGSLIREIKAYSLESLCTACNYRGEFSTVCPECGSDNILLGYGNDTGIYISTENLTDSITYSTDEGSVKNCFKLEAGDDLMTATLINCNPNGSGCIWYVSDEVKEDMSSELVAALNAYDTQYEYYNNDYTITANSGARSAYNDLVNTYNGLISQHFVSSEKTYSLLPTTITGYPALMQEYYNTIDFYLYLNNSLMPSVEMSGTSATQEASKLSGLSTVAVQKLEGCSVSTATSAVLAMAKAIISSTYQVKINDENLTDTTWSGRFTITNYSNDEDTYTTNLKYVTINENYEDFVRQKIDKVLGKSNDDTTDIISLFGLEKTSFEAELHKYGLSSLKLFHDCCQSCLDILIEQGAANGEGELYNNIYLPYYEKLGVIDAEILTRESEIATIIGVYDVDGRVLTPGIQTILEDERNLIQNALNFEEYLGEDLWLEFVSYRREDTYKNDNYISDGLNNAELFQNALEFIEVAKKEIFKSATLQHSISATLKNLLVMKEFESIVEDFEIGNWLRVNVDGQLNILRLIEYEINFESLDSLSVTFSDVKTIKDGASDVESILNQASSMASSYGAVTRQATKGNKGNSQLNDWVSKGLALTNMKIVNSADNQNITMDSHGLLAREYLPITDEYDERQLKLINKGLYLTDDNWLTSRAGIGNFTYYNPETQKHETAYGVIADTLVGSLVLAEKVGVYNEEKSITLGENGIVITADGTGENTNGMTFTIQKKILNSGGNEEFMPVMYIDSNGNVILNGTIRINTSSASDTTLGDLADEDKLNQRISEQMSGEIKEINETIDSKYEAAEAYANNMLNNYKTDVGQYITYDENNGLTLGAKPPVGTTSNSFKTVIDNQSIRFMELDTNGEATRVSYISNKQLFIPNAVIESGLKIGKYFASTRKGGGFSISWHSDNE